MIIDYSDFVDILWEKDLHKNLTFFDIVDGSFESLAWKLKGKGLKYVFQMFNEDRNLLSFEALNEKFDLNLNFLQYGHLIFNIPKEWKRNFCNSTFEDILGEPLDVMHDTKSLPKSIYNTLKALHEKDTDRIRQKWSDILNLEIDIDEWKLLCTRRRKWTLDTKHTAFQYKLLLRFLPTNNRLYKMNLSESRFCSFCNNEIETLEHFFYSCDVSKRIWKTLERWLKAKGITNDDITPKDILLGEVEQSTIFNTIIIVTKFFLYRCKFQRTVPSFQMLLNTIDYYYKTEMYAAKFIKKESFFKRKWKKIFPLS